MFPKTLLPLIVGFTIMVQGCSRPDTVPTTAQAENFNFSQATPFHWGMNKAEIASFLPPDKFDTAWNSIRTQGSFERFGEVQYLLFFSFDDNKLIKTNITLIKTKSLDEVINKLFDSYNYIKSIGFHFAGNTHNLDKKNFRVLAQKRKFIPGLNLWVYAPISTLPSRHNFVIYINESTGSNEKEYEAILQISRS